MNSLQWGADATRLFGADVFNGLDALFGRPPASLSPILQIVWQLGIESICAQQPISFYGEAGDVFPTGEISHKFQRRRRHGD